MLLQPQSAGGAARKKKKKSANPMLSEIEGKKKAGIYTEWMESSPTNTELDMHKKKIYIYKREKLIFKKWQQYIKGTSLS